MTMALAVAMVACSGAAGTPGPAGPPGKDAPTPDPTTPTTPTTPTEPAGPSGAAPEVTKVILPVYLALEGTGKMTSKLIGFDAHIRDTDSQLKFSAESSDPTIAKLSTLHENSRDVTITAVRVGTATITVEARDGDNDPLKVPISVTVVRNNARPTTNDLSQFDKDELEERLYVADGPRTDTVTVVTTAGVTSSEFEDSISATDFKVVVGADGDKDDLVTVKVTKSTGNKYVIDLTPKPKVLDVDEKKSQAIKIYPKDKFGATSLEAWTFMAMFNTPPRVLVDSFPTIRLTRPVTTGTGIYVGTTLDSALVALGEDNVIVDTIEIADYFDWGSLQRTVNSNGATGIGTDGLTGSDTAAVAVEAAKIDDADDTTCAVSIDPPTSLLAGTQLLNEAGALLMDTAEVVGAYLIKSPQALGGIRIDSRFSAFGSPKVANTRPADPPTEAQQKTKDTIATGEGAFDIVIRCTDKDDTAEVRGTVVVQQAAQ